MKFSDYKKLPKKILPFPVFQKIGQSSSAPMQKGFRYLGIMQIKIKKPTKQTDQVSVTLTPFP